ncbi:1-deoxy-D-xylulose-5-phosphate synthase [Macrococcoides bohemicum]|uniref:1-deoxy-D-xylulose-5-phosphate synthase n=1 Tax=Macrococcoides bohemicum TaxID=1903056 RepID=A0A328A7C5_9STAP|nr:MULTISPECIES: 1-deoxy-D-xylulose-5-phosphate synthase [Macrococcus]ATD30236.1 1-deoxy-D-xylulose-5-phosphate synthase [Macrococcus sp. IME1552]MBC9873235.1 1-deoxy-D-xylulose-5-phosphate synthase [Macrococcus bohemicus]QRN50054.1 1-deoxy-D-xylulose-5-phosphate synthase [Macrococcus bohemicus]QYA41492.1 1-deoxy-D-xylulose-5-phosphate synthase [Macrococcus bohemicus]QYA43917.1 1-deoxy-D-xylulose-5-phosphate synthase [Macrococcus bohemicus]
MDVSKIKDPSFIKNLTDDELVELSGDIRQFLIEKCAITGGHIGANLGVVELTIAMHRSFNSPQDKLIFDVGHQAYIHKILTGRGEKFDTLRQYKGLSGFPKLNESPHDVWEAGHSSTSLSAAIGMAKARDILGEDYDVVPIIGDGALTGGMALEALNHIGHDKTDMTIVLNDNEMSIAPNVGAMHNMFGRLRTNQNYNRAKVDIDGFLSKLPGGHKLRDSADRIKDSLKYLVVTGVFFEELGIKYVGPVDGHNFNDLKEAFETSKRINGPVIVHVITKKGKGYRPAENDKIGTWHGLGPYKLETGEQVKGSSKAPAWSQIFSDTVQSFAEKDKHIVAITPAMPVGSKLTRFQAELPDQFFDVGIAEQHAVTMAGGLAANGMKPYVAIYSTFLQRAYDQMLHDVDRQNLHVVFGIDRSGLVGADGETHQGVFDIPFLSHMPNITIMMPKDENEARHMLHSAFYEYTGPIAIRYPRGNGIGVDVDANLQPVPYGKWETLHDGEDVAVLSFGPTLQLIEEVRDELLKEGINIEVVNARFIKPLDTDYLDKIAKENKAIITVEESMLSGGFGSLIVNYFNDRHQHIDIKRIGIDDEYIEHGDVELLLNDIGISKANIINEIKQSLKRKHEKN